MRAAGVGSPADGVESTAGGIGWVAGDDCTAAGADCAVAEVDRLFSPVGSGHLRLTGLHPQSYLGSVEVACSGYSGFPIYGKAPDCGPADYFVHMDVALPC